MKDYIITKPNTLLNGVDKILNYLSKIKTDNIDERINFLINTKLNNPETLEYVEKTENSFEIFSSEANMNEKISFIFDENNVYVNAISYCWDGDYSGTKYDDIESFDYVIQTKNIDEIKYMFNKLIWI